MPTVAHDDVIPQLADHLGPIFESSPDGVSTLPAETEMIPLSFGGHVVAYHFVRQVGGR